MKASFKKIGLILILISTVGLSGCDKASKPSLINKSQLKKGINYIWFPGQECNPAEEMTYIGLPSQCLTREDYEKFCKSSVDLTKGAIIIMAAYDHRSMVLAQGGEITDTSVTWNENYKDYPCRASFSAEGLINGTSSKTKVDGGARTFIINKDNELLVSAANPQS